MSKIIFSNALLEKFVRTRKSGAAVGTFSAPFTHQVIEEMGWGEMAVWLTGGEPEGELAASVIELQPNEKANRHLAIELKVSKVHKFRIVRLELEGKKGSGYRLEIRFKVDVADLAGCRKMEEFMLGCQKCRMIVLYAPAAKQEGLFAGGSRVDVNTGETEDPGEAEAEPVAVQALLAPAEDTAGCNECDDGIDMSDDDLTHVTGIVCVVARRNRDALKPVDENAAFVERSKTQEKAKAARRRSITPERPKQGKKNVEFTEI